ncbi:hypothetical protein HJC23_011109 [Cyclotella cryptica]|uniref:DNL-type domain-containing protein n=1 Tax=Cyclotella cryptica TaxID=29204 RepID=A0ABD3PV38_9STRA|eukprot:CCRYP_011985-RA/>CCRYP_011985-RA protein AED:0.17 eAED:0.17 QI:89/1/1/1/1/1/2/1465/218
MLAFQLSRSVRTVTFMCTRQKPPPGLYCGVILKSPQSVHVRDEWKTPEQIPLRLLHNTSFTFTRNNGNDGSIAYEDESVEFVGEIGNGAVIDKSNSNEVDLSHNSNELPGSFTDIPGTTNTKAKTLAIIFTCKVCNTRSAKQFTEHAYRHGVVLVRCPGCENLHLIADRLGMFEDRGEDGKGWDVQKALATAGENVKAVSHDNILELTVDDIVGSKDS